jgi:hypothetical protein
LSSCCCYFAKFPLKGGAKKKGFFVLCFFLNYPLGGGREKKRTLDTAAHEQHSFFFPDNGHGAANAAGFGWRNGGLSPCVFFVLSYLLNSPLGEREKA